MIEKYGENVKIHDNYMNLWRQDTIWIENFLYYTKTEIDGCICIVRGSGKMDRTSVSYAERKELPAPGFRDFSHSGWSQGCSS